MIRNTMITMRTVFGVVVTTAVMIMIFMFWALPSEWFINEFHLWKYEEDKSHEFALHLQNQLKGFCMKMTKLPHVVSVAKATYEKTKCTNLQTRKRGFVPCVNSTCPAKIPDSAELRVLQLRAKHMKVSKDQMNVIMRISTEVEKRKFLFLTAASSNHYHEAQALVFNLKKFVFNRLNTSEFTFVYVNLGLSLYEKRQVKKHCGCIVVDMPFKLFPIHIKNLLCYAWKPLIVKSMLPKAEFLIYMDASVRFKENVSFEVIAELLKQRGALFHQKGWAIPNHTLQPMFDFFGDMPCMYSAFAEVHATNLFFSNQLFIDKVVLDPWVACALNKSCICPVPHFKVIGCPHRTTQVGECHRFDQSSISIIFEKLYREKISYLHLSDLRPDIRRGDKMNFFKD